MEFLTSQDWFGAKLLNLKINAMSWQINTILHVPANCNKIESFQKL